MGVAETSAPDEVHESCSSLRARSGMLRARASTCPTTGSSTPSATLRTDDPTDEIGAAWGIKEQLRRLLASGSLAEAAEQKMLLGAYVLAADMPETDRLWATITAWSPAIEVLLVTGVTNAGTEAANTSIEQTKRTGRGYRNPAHYRARILLASAARTAFASSVRAAASPTRRRRTTEAVCQQAADKIPAVTPLPVGPTKRAGHQGPAAPLDVVSEVLDHSSATITRTLLVRPMCPGRRHQGHSTTSACCN
jgi:hypothetical protein